MLSHTVWDHNDYGGEKHYSVQYIYIITYIYIHKFWAGTVTVTTTKSTPLTPIRWGGSKESTGFICYCYMVLGRHGSQRHNDWDTGGVAAFNSVSRSISICESQSDQFDTQANPMYSRSLSPKDAPTLLRGRWHCPKLRTRSQDYCSGHRWQIKQAQGLFKSSFQLLF